MNKSTGSEKFIVQCELDGYYLNIQQYWPSLEEAEQYAEIVDVGSEPQALRIVNEVGLVCGWVSRNGHRPGGALDSKLYK